MTPRASIEARVLVTPRMRPLWVEGRTVHQVGLAVSLGLQRPGERRRRQRSAGDLAKSPTCASWKPRRWSATSSPDAAREDAAAIDARFEKRRSSRHEHRSPHFSPTRRCASAAKPARSPARNGTARSRRLQLDRQSPTTTPGAVGHSTWRHVKFVEHAPEPGIGGNNADLASWDFRPTSASTAKTPDAWKACPTGAIVRTEFGGVLLQPDVCNGCSYCVVACPFGVVQTNTRRRPRLQVHFLLRPAESRTEAGLRDRRVRPSRSSSARSSRCEIVAAGAHEGTAVPRHGRRALLRSAAHQRRRHPRSFHRARRSAAIQPAAQPRSADDLFEKRGGRVRPLPLGFCWSAASSHSSGAGDERVERRLPNIDLGREKRLYAIRAKKPNARARSRRSACVRQARPFPSLRPQTGYYGIPMLKEPQWTWEIPLYFFVGGAAGSAAVIGTMAHWTGADLRLRATAATSLPAERCSPARLLISDLGRPERFLDMLRVFKPQSPMSMGAWTLAGFGTFSGAAAFAELPHRFHRDPCRSACSATLPKASHASSGFPFPTTPAS